MRAQLEEGLVVATQRFGGEGLEDIAQVSFGRLEVCQLLLDPDLLCFELGGEPSTRAAKSIGLLA